MMKNWKTLFELCTVERNPQSRNGAHITAMRNLRRCDPCETRMEENFRRTGEYVLLRGKENGSFPGLLREVNAAPVREIGEEEILRLCQSVPQQYRRSAIFLMNAVTLHELYSGLIGSTICRITCGAGGGFEIMNTPVMLTNAMPCIDAGNVPVLYGDFSRILIEDGSRDDLRQEPRENVPDGVVCTLSGYMNCRLLDKEAVKGLKIL